MNGPNKQIARIFDLVQRLGDLYRIRESRGISYLVEVPEDLYQMRSFQEWVQPVAHATPNVSFPFCLIGSVEVSGQPVGLFP